MHPHVDILVVGLDYCGSCRGSCPTCVLTAAERALDVPLMRPADAERAFASMAATYPSVREVALGIGRGNNLALPASSVADHLAIAAAARRHLDFATGVLEVSTSLVGKLEPQVERAKRIVEAFRADPCGFDPRFAVVANTALGSPRYWANIDAFLSAMQEFRGGPADGHGDIISLNLGIDSLPDLATVEALVSRYRFPVNLVWVPTFDPGAATEGGLARLGAWVAGFWAMAARLGLDANVVNRTADALSQRAEGLAQLAHHVSRSAGAVVYVAPDGRWHEGFTSVLAEMDPVRFDPEAEVVRGQRRMVGDPRRDIARLMRNPACTACPGFSACVLSGAYKLGLLALRRHPGGTRACPSGMRETFELAAAGRDGGTP